MLFQRQNPVHNDLSGTSANDFRQKHSWVKNSRGNRKQLLPRTKSSGKVILSPPCSKGITDAEGFKTWSPSFRLTWPKSLLYFKNASFVEKVSPYLETAASEPAWISMAKLKQKGFQDHPLAKEHKDEDKALTKVDQGEVEYQGMLCVCESCPRSPGYFCKLFNIVFAGGALWALLTESFAGLAFKTLRQRAAAGEQTPVTILSQGLVSELDHPVCSFSLLKLSLFRAFLLPRAYLCSCFELH